MRWGTVVGGNHLPERPEGSSTALRGPGEACLKASCVRDKSLETSASHSPCEKPNASREAPEPRRKVQSPPTKDHRIVPGPTRWRLKRNESNMESAVPPGRPQANRAGRGLNHSIRLAHSLPRKNRELRGSETSTRVFISIPPTIGVPTFIPRYHQSSRKHGSAHW